MRRGHQLGGLVQEARTSPPLPFTDLPFLVTLSGPDDAPVPGKFLTPADLGDTAAGADFKTVLVDGRTGRPTGPNGTLGDRFSDAGKGKWNLDLGDVDPRPSLYGEGDVAEVNLPRFDSAGGEARVLRRGVPVWTVAGHRVTTVFDLLLAQYGVGRPGRTTGSTPTRSTARSSP